MSDSEKVRAEIGRRLYAHCPSPGEYQDDLYQPHLLEQYKLYVEMADRISERRGVANAFFATLNTVLLTSIIGFIEAHKSENAYILPLVGIVVSIVWAVLLRSYRNLNSAKFTVVGLLEEKLPASPYWHAEWYALGEGKNWRKHIPLSPIETYVPAVFAMFYAFLVYSWYG